MCQNDYTGLLYACPSSMEGFARVLDLGNTFDGYNYSANETEADEAAMASDWYAVGADLLRAIRCYSRKMGVDASHGKRPAAR